MDMDEYLNVFFQCNYKFKYSSFYFYIDFVGVLESSAMQIVVSTPVPIYKKLIASPQSDKKNKHASIILH